MVVINCVINARTAVSTVDDVRQALYREAQLALRAFVGARELDTFLMETDRVASELNEMVRVRAKALGVELIAVGIRDVTLPGEMKNQMNRVTEAKKAAEANHIARRQEMAGIRSQANTAKLQVVNPIRMRLRELKVLPVEHFQQPAVGFFGRLPLYCARGMRTGCARRQSMRNAERSAGINARGVDHRTDHWDARLSRS